MVLRPFDQIGTHAALGVERCARGRIGGQFNGPDQTQTACVAHERMAFEALDALLQARADFLHMRHDVVALVDAQRFEGDSAGQRMAAVGVAVAEHADLGAGIGNRLVDLVGDIQRGHGHIRRGQHLGHSEHVGLELIDTGAEVLAQAAKGGDHLVDQEQDVVFLQNRLDFGEVARGRDDHAACALHRLGNKGGHGIRPFAQDGVFEFFGQPVHKLRLGFTWQTEAVKVRAADAHDAGQRQVEVLVHGAQAGHGRRRRCDPVVAFVARDDFFLEWFAACVVVVPHQFERGVVGLGTRVRKQHTRMRNR